MEINSKDIVVVSIIDDNTELHKIEDNHYLFNKTENTYQLVQVTTKDENSAQGKGEDKKIWSAETTLSFIKLVEEYDEQFKNSVKKNVWNKIATSLGEKYGITIKWQQCDTKWKGLNKTYREVKEHNAKTGRNKRRWEYYDIMDKMLFKKPEITPVATCSNYNGLVVNNRQDNSEENLSDNICAPSDSKQDSFKSTFARKRANTANAVERRHAEKMQRQDKFLGFFEDYLNIIRDKKTE